MTVAMATSKTTGQIDGTTAGCGKGWGAEDFFSASHLGLLQGAMTLRRLEAGTHLFWEGDEAGKLYLVRSGRIKLSKTTEEGRNLNLSIMRQGDLFGELKCGSDTQFGYSAEVIEAAEVGVIGELELEALIAKQGDFAVAFTKWSALQQRSMQSKFRDLLLFGKPGALASTLIRMANTYGVVTPSGIRLDTKLTNTDLAEFIGATRESVNRMLAELKSDGILETENGCLVVKSLTALKAICQCPTFPACSREICRI